FGSPMVGVARMFALTGASMTPRDGSGLIWAGPHAAARRRQRSSRTPGLLREESYIAPVASLATALDSAGAQYTTPTGTDHRISGIDFHAASQHQQPGRKFACGDFSG
ncbi:MAG: hypothetical protein ACYCVB_12790, partial [Bacilli bacterium]